MPHNTPATSRGLDWILAKRMQPDQHLFDVALSTIVVCGRQNLFTPTIKTVDAVSLSNVRSFALKVALHAYQVWNRFSSTLLLLPSLLQLLSLTNPQLDLL